MDKQEIVMNSLEEAQGRNPIEFQFGFFLEDDNDQSFGGSFFWYKTESEMQQVLQNDLIEALSDGERQDIETAKAEVASLIENFKSNTHNNKGSLLDGLNEFLTGLELRLQFIGSFDELCKNKDEWSKYLREEFREELFEDIERFSTKKLQNPIKQNEQEKFAQFVSEYLI